jgi:hypothetical protein
MFALFMLASPLLPICLLPIHLVHAYFAIVSFWPSRFKDSFKKDDMQQKEFDEDLGWLVVKNNLSIQYIESV